MLPVLNLIQLTRYCFVKTTPYLFSIIPGGAKDFIYPNELHESFWTRFGDFCSTSEYKKHHKIFQRKACIWNYISQSYLIWLQYISRFKYFLKTCCLAKGHIPVCQFDAASFFLRIILDIYLCVLCMVTVTTYEDGHDCVLILCNFGWYLTSSIGFLNKPILFTEMKSKTVILLVVSHIKVSVTNPCNCLESLIFTFSLLSLIVYWPVFCLMHNDNSERQDAGGGS